MPKKRSPEELAEDNERTSSIGLFLTGEAYWKSANVLYRSGKRRKHALSFPFSDKPIYFCYYHAIELYLKALLRQHHGVDELEDKFRHSATKMMNRAKEFGIALDDEDVEVLSLMGETDGVIRARYTRTGAFTWPTLEALNRTCKSLRLSVSAALKKAGVTTQLIRSFARPGKRPKPWGNSHIPTR